MTDSWHSLSQVNHLEAISGPHCLLDTPQSNGQGVKLLWCHPSIMKKFALPPTLILMNTVNSYDYSHQIKCSNVILNWVSVTMVVT